MANIRSHTGKELYKVEIKSSKGKVLISDEPTDKGGQNLGLSATELLAASLAACTSVTLRMYANRKDWDLEEIDTEIDLTTEDETNKTTITRNIHLKGNLDEAQRKRLLYIASKCPVHKMLSNTIEIETYMV